MTIRKYGRTSIRMDKDTIAITIKMDRDAHKRFKHYCVEKGVTFKDIFIGHMEKLLADEEGSKAGK